MLTISSSNKVSAAFANICLRYVQSFVSFFVYKKFGQEPKRKLASMAWYQSNYRKKLVLYLQIPINNSPTLQKSCARAADGKISSQFQIFLILTTLIVINKY